MLWVEGGMFILHLSFRRAFRASEFGAYLSGSIDDLTIVFHTFVSNALGERRFYGWIICIQKVALIRSLEMDPQ